MAAKVRDGVSGGDASPKEHAQRRSDGDPTAGGQPVPGAAAATDNTEVADLMRMMLLSQATAEKNRADAEARLVARLTALEERQLAAENGSAAVLGGAQSTEGSVKLAGSCDGGGSPGVAVAGNETEAHDGGHVPPAFEDATGKHQSTAKILAEKGGSPTLGSTRETDEKKRGRNSARAPALATEDQPSEPSDETPWAANETSRLIERPGMQHKK